MFFRQLDCPTAEMQAHQNRVFRERIAEMGLSLVEAQQAPVELNEHNLKPCSGFWKSPVIGWNGEVTVCTRDNRFENSIGNLKDASFSELWWSAEQEEVRRRVSQGDYSGCSLCKTCFIPKSSNYTGISAEEIRLHQEWEAACK